MELEPRRTFTLTLDDHETTTLRNILHFVTLLNDFDPDEVAFAEVFLNEYREAHAD